MTRNVLYKEIVSSLKTKSEEELKWIYLNLFVNDLQIKWETITQKANFGNITEKRLLSKISKTKRRSFIKHFPS
jgi:hypothetical protein